MTLEKSLEENKEKLEEVSKKLVHLYDLSFNDRKKKLFEECMESLHETIDNLKQNISTTKEIKEKL